jgi:hypothetical protein
MCSSFNQFVLSPLMFIRLFPTWSGYTFGAAFAFMRLRYSDRPAPRKTTGMPSARVRPTWDVARIECAEVPLGQHRAPVLRRLEIEIDKFVHGAAVQKA